MIRPSFMLIVAIVATGCGGDSPTSPSVVSFQGVWQGQWARQQCSETGGAIGVGCTALPIGGGLRVTVQQDGTTVNATIEQGTIQMQATGLVSAGSVMTLTGQTNVGGVTFAVAGWQTTANGSTLSGSYTLNITPDDASLGTIRATNALSGVVKVG